ncbi:MAG: interleukin-like EMT inducer domain-containing protein [Anaerolineae bacterium]|nr:interleukin-like EMT inducer domain-containing protein [Anaerolineae bacterium]
MSLRRLLRSHHLWALSGYTLLSLLLTLPLALRFTTHVPGDGIDDPALAWNLWWVKFSLVDRQLNPFDSRWMFYPLGINLAFYTLTVWNGLLAVPLQVSVGLVPASNLVLLSSFVLGGYGAYLLALWALAQGRGDRPCAARYAAAFLAGLLYAFSSSKLFYASLGQFNIASSQWVPFAALYALRCLRPAARRREALLAALFLLMQAYAELTYASFLAVFIALAAAWRGVQWAEARAQSRQNGLEDGRWLGNLAALALLFVVGLAPVLANMVPDLRAEGDFLVEGGGFADLFSADLAGFLLPTQLHPLFGDVVRTLADDSQLRPDGSQWQVNKGQHLTLGYLGLALTLAGGWLAWRRRREEQPWPSLAFWAAAAALFFLLTLGPTLRVMGHDTGVPGPFRLLQELPLFKGNRYPSRWSVMLLLAASVLLAAAAEAALAWAQRRRPAQRWAPSLVATALAGGLLIENLSVPLPLSDMRIPAIYDRIARAEGSFAVLDLPTGWRNGFSVFGKQDVIIMFQQWWQTRHGRPILGGNTSRNPEHKFRYFLEAPLIGPLTVLANADDGHPHVRRALAPALEGIRQGDPSLGGNAMLQAAAADAAAVLAALDVAYVVVQTDRVPPEYTRFVERYLPLTLVAEEGPRRLYRPVYAPSPGPVVVRPAADPLSRGEGWSGAGQGTARPPGAEEAALWAHRRETRLLLPPASPGARRIAVRAMAAGPGQTVALEVNGHRTPPQPLPTQWAALLFEVPAGALTEDANEVLLRFGRTYPVADAAAAFGLAPVNLLVESAGLEAGNYGHIWLNGRNVSPNSRGYNLAIVDGASGRLISAAHFDTHADPDASTALIAYLQGLGQQEILAVAVKDTAADQLSAEAAEALAQLGLTDLRGRFRWSQAALVLPAPAPGAARPVVEAVDAVQGVRVGLGMGWREPQVAAAVAWLRAEE